LKNIQNLTLAGQTHTTYEAGTAMFFRNCTHLEKYLPIALLIGSRLTDEPGRMNPGFSLQGINYQSGIVCQSQVWRELAVIARLVASVFLKRVPLFRAWRQTR